MGDIEWLDVICRDCEGIVRGMARPEPDRFHIPRHNAPGGGPCPGHKHGRHKLHDLGEPGVVTRPLWRAEHGPRLAVELGQDHNVYVVANDQRVIVTNVDALIQSLHGAIMWRNITDDDPA